MSLNGYIIARLGEAIGRPGASDAPVSAEARSTRTLTWLLVANVAAVALAGLAALVIVLVASFEELMRNRRGRGCRLRHGARRLAPWKASAWWDAEPTDLA